MENDLSYVEKIIEQEVQKRVNEIMAQKETKEPEEIIKTPEEIINDFADYLSELDEKNQYKILLELIRVDGMSLYEFFAENQDYMGKDYVNSKKRQIALQLLLESFLNE